MANDRVYDALARGLFGNQSSVIEPRTLAVSRELARYLDLVVDDAEVSVGWGGRVVFTTEYDHTGGIQVEVGRDGEVLVIESFRRGGIDARSAAITVAELLCDERAADRVRVSGFREASNGGDG